MQWCCCTEYVVLLGLPFLLRFSLRPDGLFISCIYEIFIFEIHRTLLHDLYVTLEYFCNIPRIGPWWRHQMETVSTLLAICAGNALVTGELPTPRPVPRCFDAFFDLRLNKRLSKQCWVWRFETPWGPLWRHHDALRTTAPLWINITRYIQAQEINFHYISRSRIWRSFPCLHYVTFMSGDWWITSDEGCGYLRLPPLDQQLLLDSWHTRICSLNKKDKDYVYRMLK